MDEIREPYIVQQSNEEALYTKLQKQTLEYVQRLSGTVWTDYNPHDPGVTLSETANYALTEIDYKYSFPLIDYLVEEDRPFIPERFGLFPPKDVFGGSIVTLDDYKRLFLSSIPEITNLQIDFDALTGAYSVSFVKTPFKGEEEQIVKKIRTIYNENRNLCEWLDKVEVAKTETLFFESEFEIYPGEDPTTVLARVYWCILYYLSDNQDSVSSNKTRTEYELYKQLYNVEGVKNFHTCFLMKSGVPQSRFPDNSTLFIPSKMDDLDDIVIYCGKTKVKIDIDLFIERLRALSLSGRANNASETGRTELPTGMWHNIFDHYPIAHDMPDCYQLNPDEEIPASSFDAYIHLYDWVMKNGLEEIQILPRLLSINKEDNDFIYTERTIMLKNNYLDFLDKLYGIDSQPSWLLEDNSYGETPEEALYRRMRCLRNVTKLQRDRAKAKNINMLETKGNIPMIKEWFCLLIGIDPDDDHIVSNVLPKHNLLLIEREKHSSDIIRRVDSLLIEEKMMDADNVQDVSYVVLSEDSDEKKNEYTEMRKLLPFFNENLITADLFRNGTNLSNYKIVKSADDEYMLMYHHHEFAGWMNLGHGTDKSILETLANILRRYLRELNHECETLYVVEPVLADQSRPSELLIVLPAWTYRFHKARFREECCKLLRSIVPAHLTGKIFWISEKRMRKFEDYYHQLLRSYTNESLIEHKKLLLGALEEQLADAEYIQTLDDSN